MLTNSGFTSQLEQHISYYTEKYIQIYELTYATNFIILNTEKSIAPMSNFKNTDRKTKSIYLQPLLLDNFTPNHRSQLNPIIIPGKISSSKSPGTTSTTSSPHSSIISS